MDAAGSSSPPAPLRIVIVPWLAFGHLLPYLELADRLASRGHRVSYVSTPRNLARLPLPLRSDVDLVALPLPRVEGLPDGAESTNDVPDDKRELHWKAFDGAARDAPPDRRYGRRRAPPAAVAGERRLFFRATGGRSRARRAAVRAGGDGASVRQRRRVVGHVQPPAQRPDGAGVHGRSYPELRRVGARVVPTRGAAPRQAGRDPRPPAAPVPDGACLATAANREHATVRWLDAQPPGSVLYVALGSEVPLRPDQVHELGLGLELAGTRFLWALRKPSGAAADDDMLPPGFQDRTTTGW
ncbi:hypothetical protein ACQ4PT_000442 [Festuca glaucescens]